MIALTVHICLDEPELDWSPGLWCARCRTKSCTYAEHGHSPERAVAKLFRLLADKVEDGSAPLIKRTLFDFMEATGTPTGIKTEDTE